VARTAKASATGAGRRAPLDVTKLHERAKALRTRIVKNVPLTVKIDLRLYQALIEAAEAHETDLSGIAREALAAGLQSIQNFAPADQFEPASIRPWAQAASRPPNAYEAITSAQMSDDPLIAAALSGGMRRGVGMQRPMRQHDARAPLDDEDLEGQLAQPAPAEPVAEEV